MDISILIVESQSFPVSFLFFFVVALLSGNSTQDAQEPGVPQDCVSDLLRCIVGWSVRLFESTRIILEDIFVLRGVGGRRRQQEARLRHTGYIPTFTEALIEKGFLNIEVFA